MWHLIYRTGICLQEDDTESKFPFSSSGNPVMSLVLFPKSCLSLIHDYCVPPLLVTSIFFIACVGFVLFHPYPLLSIYPTYSGLILNDRDFLEHVSFPISQINYFSFVLLFYLYVWKIPDWLNLPFLLMDLKGELLICSYLNIFFLCCLLWRY